VFDVEREAQIPTGEEERTDDPSDAPAVIDLAGVAFGRRLANLLLVSRKQQGVSRRTLARRSGGTFTNRDLKAAETAKRPFGPTAVGELAALYRVDLAVILPERLPLAIDEGGVISTGGIEIRFVPGDEDSLLTAYLKLVRVLRRQQHARAVDLRRGDIEAIATHLESDPLPLLDRLGALMGGTRAQRRTMAALFATGAMVVGLSSGASAGMAPGEFDPSSTVPPMVVEVPTATVPEGPPVTVPSSRPRPTPVAPPVTPQVTAPPVTAPMVTAPAPSPVSAPSVTAPERRPVSAPPVTVPPSVVPPSIAPPAPGAVVVPIAPPAGTEGEVVIVIEPDWSSEMLGVGEPPLPIPGPVAG
jgi:hypothetical protein